MKSCKICHLLFEIKLYTMIIKQNSGNMVPLTPEILLQFYLSSTQHKLLIIMIKKTTKSKQHKYSNNKLRVMKQIRQKKSMMK